MDDEIKGLIIRLREYSPHLYDPDRADEAYKTALSERRKVVRKRKKDLSVERRKLIRKVSVASTIHPPDRDISYFREKLKAYFGG